MKDVHRIELGQWPPAMFVITSKRGYYAFWRKYVDASFERFPFPIPGAAHCQKLVDEKAGKCMFILVIGQHASRDQLAASLAHEATHAMRWLFEHIGETEPGTEAQAYLVEHIVRSGLKAVPHG